MLYEVITGSGAWNSMFFSVSFLKIFSAASESAFSGVFNDFCSASVFFLVVPWSEGSCFSIFSVSVLLISSLGIVL